MKEDASISTNGMYRNGELTSLGMASLSLRLGVLGISLVWAILGFSCADTKKNVFFEEVKKISIGTPYNEKLQNRLGTPLLVYHEKKEYPPDLAWPPGTKMALKWGSFSNDHFYCRAALFVDSNGLVRTIHIFIPSEEQPH